MNTFMECRPKNIPAVRNGPACRSTGNNATAKAMDNTPSTFSPHLSRIQNPRIDINAPPDHTHRRHWNKRTPQRVVTSCANIPAKKANNHLFKTHSPQNVPRHPGSPVNNSGVNAHVHQCLAVANWRNG